MAECDQSSSISSSQSEMSNSIQKIFILSFLYFLFIAKLGRFSVSHHLTMSICVFLHDKNSKLEGTHKHIFENDKILKIFVFLINWHNINQHTTSPERYISLELTCKSSHLWRPTRRSSPSWSGSRPHRKICPVHLLILTRSLRCEVRGLTWCCWRWPSCLVCPVRVSSRLTCERRVWRDDPH